MHVKQLGQSLFPLFGQPKPIFSLRVIDFEPTTLTPFYLWCSHARFPSLCTTRARQTLSSQSS